LRTVRALLSEGSSLTSREAVTCLGPLGWRLGVLDPNPWCFARLSRWVANVPRCRPAAVDPIGYLKCLETIVSEQQIDVVLPTHEQARLLAAARPHLPAALPVAVSELAAFDRVQSKVQFAVLLNELELPQPPWRLIRSERDLAALSLPYG
jgi:hypothetical protein